MCTATKIENVVMYKHLNAHNTHTHTRISFVSTVECSQIGNQFKSQELCNKQALMVCKYHFLLNGCSKASCSVVLRCSLCEGCGGFRWGQRACCEINRVTADECLSVPWALILTVYLICLSLSLLPPFSLLLCGAQALPWIRHLLLPRSR